MPARECVHCKQRIEAGEAHDCWTTTERALTSHLSDDLQEAWQRLRETAVEFGDQRIYASHHSIMFARKVCYFFVRPKPKYLEVCVFLGRAIRDSRFKLVVKTSKSKTAHLFRVTHRDEVEPPMTDWLQEAYDFADPAKTKVKDAPKASKAARRTAAAGLRKKSPAARSRSKPPLRRRAAPSR